MKKVLIVEQNSYLGKNLKNHLLNRSRGFMVNTISPETDDWKALDFGIFDCVINLADTDPESEKMNTTEAAEDKIEQRYYDINCNLAYDLAQKSKLDGVPSYLYISTIKVYGKTGQIGKTILIDKTTPLSPVSVYEKTKLAGEEKIRELESDDFCITVLRPPLIYGADCPGDYQNLKQTLESCDKLPALRNQLSAIHISTLCAFIQYLIEQNITGTFHPQNKDYLSTLELLDMISKEENISFKISKFYAFRLKLFKSSVPKELHQCFGSIIYSKDIDL